MENYTLQVTTGNMLHAATFDNLYVTLIGTERQSERTKLTNCDLDCKIGQTGNYTVTTLFSLGCLLLLKLEKDSDYGLPENEWFCSKIVVTTPDDDAILFPCHRWVSNGELVVLRGGRATKAFEDDHPRLVDQRKKELALQKQIYPWSKYVEGLPYIINIIGNKDIPAEVSWSSSKRIQAIYRNFEVAVELTLKGLIHSTEQWESFEAMKNILWFKRTPKSEYVSEHWKEDSFFGYQFLNGADANMIQRCLELPSNFPVTEEMVKPFLANGSSLTTEMKKGNIFICDYKKMEGLPTKVVDGKPVHLTAALCLFYMSPEKKLMPIAIQLGQQPSEKNPIFLPSDLESDWLLAKIFVRNADFLNNEFISHLLNVHMLTEVFTMATLRNLPMIHPLYKLLIPHHRGTLYISNLARLQAYGPSGTLMNSSLNFEGATELFRRALSETTYSSLCLPENIATRGLESIPNFYYRDDGLKLWAIINRFVKAVVAYYYPSDSDVSLDSELQQWINEIFTYGFLGNNNSGIPESFQTVEEVIKFVTMVIYTSSAQHAAVHNGQFDYFSWMPNAPVILHKAPPTAKEQSSMEAILETLPNKAITSNIIAFAWRISKKYDDFVPLGTYPEVHFDEPAAKQMIKDFQAELSSLSVSIAKRNLELELPYDYLNPAEVENSVCI